MRACACVCVRVAVPLRFQSFPDCVMPFSGDIVETLVSSVATEGSESGFALITRWCHLASAVLFEVGTFELGRVTDRVWKPYAPAPVRGLVCAGNCRGIAVFLR